MSHLEAAVRSLALLRLKASLSCAKRLRSWLTVQNRRPSTNQRISSQANLFSLVAQPSLSIDAPCWLERAHTDATGSVSQDGCAYEVLRRDGSWRQSIQISIHSIRLVKMKRNKVLDGAPDSPTVFNNPLSLVLAAAGLARPCFSGPLYSPLSRRQ